MENNGALVIFTEERADDLKVGPTVCMSECGGHVFDWLGILARTHGWFPERCGSVAAEFIAFAVRFRDSLPRTIEAQQTPQDVADALQPSGATEVALAAILAAYGGGRAVYVVDTYSGNVMSYGENEGQGFGWLESKQVSGAVDNEDQN